MRRIAPDEVDETRAARGSLPHGVDRGKSALQFITHDFLRRRAVIARDADRLGGQPLRRHVGGRRVDEIARERRCTRELHDVRVIDGRRRDEPCPRHGWLGDDL